MRPRFDVPRLAAGRHRVRLPLRRQPVRALPAPLRRERAARSADRRQGRRGARATARAATSSSLGAGERRSASRASSSSTARASAACSIEEAFEDRLRGLVALAAVRPRRRRALRIRAPAAALHAFHGAQRRLAVAHPAAAPDRQRLCVLQPIHQRRRSRARRCSPTWTASGWPSHAPLQVRDRHAAQGMEQQLRRHRPVERLPGAAGVDQHPAHPERRSRGCSSFFPTSVPSEPDIAEYNRLMRARVRAHPRLRDLALPRPAARRRAALALLPRDEHPGDA